MASSLWLVRAQRIFRRHQQIEQHLLDIPRVYFTWWARPTIVRAFQRATLCGEQRITYQIAVVRFRGQVRHQSGFAVVAAGHEGVRERFARCHLNQAVVVVGWQAEPEAPMRYLQNLEDLLV